MINIKQLLLEGAVIELPYQEEKIDWVGTAKIHIFAGYFSLPNVIVQIPKVIDKEYPISEIDLAIKVFTKAIFNKKNLQYKMHETLIELNGKENYLDLEIEEDYKKIKNLQLENQKRKKSTEQLKYDIFIKELENEKTTDTE